MARVVAFLTLRHIEMFSCELFTLFQSIKRWTGELFSSLSNAVLRQSSIASLTAVTNKMTMRGTASSPGFDAPKIGGICRVVSDENYIGTFFQTLTSRIMMIKK